MTRKMKPFSGRIVKRADGGEVREGSHSRISDETRQKALDYVAKMTTLKSLSDAGPPSPTPRRAAAARPAAARSTPKVTDTGASGESIRAARPAAARSTPKVTDTGASGESIRAARTSAPAAPSSEKPFNPMARQAEKQAAMRKASEERTGTTAERRIAEGLGQAAMLAPAGRIAKAAHSALRRGAESVGQQYEKVRGAQQARAAAKQREAAREAQRSPRDVDESRFADEGNPNYRRGGTVKESKQMMAKEVAFMKKKGAPKSMVRHEMKEAGMKKYAKGGGVESRGKTRGKMC